MRTARFARPQWFVFLSMMVAMLAWARSGQAHPDDHGTPEAVTSTTPGSTANYGTLIPARPLADTPLQTSDGRSFKFSELRGKWILIQFDSGACGEYCERKLYFMRQVRKALGKDTTRVERLWLVTDAQAPNPRLLNLINWSLYTTAGNTRNWKAERACWLSNIPPPDLPGNYWVARC